MSDFDEHPDYYLGLGHRLRVARIALGISEAEAATSAKRSVRTWRKYEETGRVRGGYPIVAFAGKYDVSLDWLVAGDGAMLRSHLGKNAQGKIAILPAKGNWYRGAQAVGLPKPA
jgi:transcriptional regulator with XRE-family HTH domain